MCLLLILFPAALNRLVANSLQMFKPTGSRLRTASTSATAECPASRHHRNEPPTSAKKKKKKETRLFYLTYILFYSTKTFFKKKCQQHKPSPPTFTPDGAWGGGGGQEMIVDLICTRFINTEVVQTVPGTVLLQCLRSGRRHRFKNKGCRPVDQRRSDTHTHTLLSWWLINNTHAREKHMIKATNIKRRHWNPIRTE